MSFIHIILVTLAEIFGDFSLQKYVDTHHRNFLGLGIAGYALVVLFLTKALEQSPILKLNLSWDGVSALIETLAAMWLLGQTFERWTQWVGALLIITGLFFIEM